MDRFTRYAWSVLGLNLLVILWGAVVRATGSGAGCGAHWPLCNGEVLPRAPSVAMAVEFSHRATSGIALLSVVALLVWAFRARPAGHPARRAALWSMLFMLAEAGVGAGLVLFELVADNRSMARALFMSVHLVNTFFMLAALALIARFASGSPAPRLAGRWTAGFAGALAATLLTGTSGAVAALGDTLFPARSLAAALEQDLSATGHLLLRLRLLHPVIAVAAGAWLLMLSFRVLVRLGDGECAALARAVALLVMVQLGAGVLNVGLLAPVWLQLVHLLLADLIWIALVLLAAAVLAEATPAEALAPAAALP